MHPEILISNGFSQNLKPAWTAIFTLILITIVTSLIGGAKPFLLFILASFTVGIFLYKRYPTIYLSFSLWMYFLSPLISRLHSYKVGGQLLAGNAAAAPLVASISIVTFIKYLPRVIKDRDPIGLGFILCFGSIIYSVLLRWLLNPTPNSLQKELGLPLSFTGPILLGFYLYIHWHNYPLFRNVLQKTFFWSAIVMGGYGIFQFIFAPGWDTSYISSIAGAKESWIGKPEPLGIRVFGTMTEPWTFSLNLISSLILLNISKLNTLGYIAAAFGYLGVLLSMCRTAWYSLAVAMFILTASLRSSKQIKFFMVTALLGIVIVPIFFIEPFSSLISERLGTFTNIGEDGSAKERLEIFHQSINVAISEFIGQGIDDSSQREIKLDNNSVIMFNSIDVGYFQILYSMGWMGTIPFLGGITLLVSKLFWKPLARIDMFAAASRAIVIASLVRVATTSILLSDFALPLWIFMGIGVSAYKYHKQQMTAPNQSKSGKFLNA
jgi:O-Antigen ligase